MHFYTIVVLPTAVQGPLTQKAAENAVHSVLLPFLDDDTGSSKGWWDWHCIGGRWDGYIAGPPEEDRALRRTIQRNLMPVVDLLARWTVEATPFAIATPDRKWHCHGRWMQAPPARWMRIAPLILERFRASLAVGVDCHL